jgi:site-specific recombinase
VDRRGGTGAGTAAAGSLASPTATPPSSPSSGSWRHSSRHTATGPRTPSRAFQDDRHARVLLDQCSEQIATLRKRAVTRGSSISLTHLLERLDQTLARIRRLLHVLDPSDPESQRRTSVELFRELVTANARRHGIRSLWQDNIKLLSRSVTQQASETGEHYITRNRRSTSECCVPAPVRG